MTQSRAKGRVHRRLKPSVALKEHFSALALQVREWAAERDGLIAVGVVGHSRGVGTSTVAFNLAHALADHAIEAPIVLVEANFGSSNYLSSAASGLCEIVSQQATLEDCLINDEKANLKFLPFGKFSLEAAIGLPWSRLVETFENGLSQFDFAIFDLASLDNPEQCVALASNLDGLILVNEPGQQRDSRFSLFQDRLSGCAVEFLGRVVNKSAD